MVVPFTKMHGIGNDYIFVDAFEYELDDPASLARRISDRHFGVGADGLILACPPVEPGNDCRMEMYNADGSRAQMCGNGIRCLARFVYERGIVPKTELAVETDAGVKTIRIERSSGGNFLAASVDMGPPQLDRDALPMIDISQDGSSKKGATDRVIDESIEVGGKSFRVSAVSMGNPHVITRIDSSESPFANSRLEELDLRRWGPLFENHEAFPERINTEFIVVRSRDEIDMRVWERGSGETLACGTGACAVVVAAALNDWSDRRVRVHLRGGDLDIEWSGDGDADSVIMTGPAEFIFDGQFEQQSTNTAV